MEGRNIELHAGNQHQRGHHLIADRGIGDRIHGGLDNTGVAQQDSLDRGGSQVLAVDPHPVSEPAGEIDVVVLVAIPQVAGVVDAAGHAFGLGVGGVVITAEPAAPRGIDDLAHHTWRTRFTRLDVGDRDLVGERAERSVGGVGGAGDGHTAFGGTESVDHDDTEPLGEPWQIPWCALVAVQDPQRIVGVVGLLRCGQDVGQRLADVVRVRRAVAADIGEESRCGELAPQANRRSRGQADGPARHDGVRVEQRHRQVDGVGGAQAEPVGEHPPRERHLVVGHPDGLGVTARARREDQHEQVVGGHVAERHRAVPVRREFGGPGFRFDVDVLHTGRHTTR